MVTVAVSGVPAVIPDGSGRRNPSATVSSWSTRVSLTAMTTKDASIAGAVMVTLFGTPEKSAVVAPSPGMAVRGISVDRAGASVRSIIRTDTVTLAPSFTS